MPRRSATVGSRNGLHARSASRFVQAAARQPVRIRISVAGGEPVPADSMLSVLSLNAAHGTEVTLHADDTPEADAALRTLADLIARDLDG